MGSEDLEKRIRVLEDLEDIKILHRDYISCLDNLEFDKVPEFFAENATLEIRHLKPCKGKKEITELYRGFVSKRRTSRDDGHLVGQPVITVEGNKAKGHWIVYIFLSKPSVQWVQGRNDCEYIKENGKWKFSSLKFGRTLASQESLLSLKK
jgi:hypothetical protein